MILRKAQHIKLRQVKLLPLCQCCQRGEQVAKAVFELIKNLMFSIQGRIVLITFLGQVQWVQRPYPGFLSSLKSNSIDSIENQCKGPLSYQNKLHTNILVTLCALS